MISYYELLGMIKDGNNPIKVKYGNIIYEWDGYNYTNEKEQYLTTSITNNYDDNEVFDKDIEILEEDKDIEELKIENDNSTHFYIRDERGTKCGMTKHSKLIAEKLNEVIKEVNKLRKDRK